MFNSLFNMSRRNAHLRQSEFAFFRILLVILFAESMPSGLMARSIFLLWQYLNALQVVALPGSEGAVPGL
jgi:hypothetical protein